VGGAGFWARAFYRRLRGRIGKSWYVAPSLEAEMQVLRECWSDGSALFHFLYGEDDFRFAGLGRRLNKRARIVVTYHQPPATFEEVVQEKRHVAALDAVIVVGSNQVAYFENIVGRGKVFHVPLGIDADFFRPASNSPNKSEARTCLFVGQWLRDFACLRDVIRLVTGKHRHVRFQVITTETGRQQLGNLPGADIQTGVRDGALRVAYQAADALVLPLLDSTANCAILEAMASGLPVVTTAVGGIGDYVDEQCALLAAAGNAEEMASKVLQLLSDDALRTRMGEAAREKAVREFDWRIVAGKIRAVHETVMNGLP